MSVSTSAIDRYPQFYRENAASQLQRYQGWMLLTQSEQKELRTAEGNEFLSKHGFVIVEWSLLSGDADDKGDWAIKKL